MENYQKHLILDTATIAQALIALNDLSNDVLTLFVLDTDNKMVGTLTDGDIRRALISGAKLETPVNTIMHTQFQCVRKNSIDVHHIVQLRTLNIDLLPCLNEDNHIETVYDLSRLDSILPIDAVLMAGGKGERLRPLTEKTPKPLLKIGDKAIIDYNIDNLTRNCIEHISVTVNYLKEQIESHYQTERNGVKINCVREPKYLGTIGSIKFVEIFYNDTILVMNSDLFTNINYEVFYFHFIDNHADMSVTVFPYSVSVPYGILDIKDNGLVGLTEKPTYNYYANAGIYLFKKELLSLIPDDTFFNATDFMELLIKKHKKVVHFPIGGFWIDIGNKDELAKARDIAKHL